MHDSTWVLAPFAVARHHLQIQMRRRENSTRKVTFHDVTVDTTETVVDDQPTLTDLIQTDEKTCG